MAGALSVQSLSKSYAGLRAVDRVSLDAADGEFVTLLGPSGSGKTTTLQMVAGFVQPDAGRVFLDGRELTGVPAYRRNIGMVFQNYALFPHMTVEQNIAFPLDARGIARAESRQRIGRALEMVGLSGLEGRTPRQLSGGQQQRVALARAIVFQPPLLLMDEPLGALDKKLRDRLQLEIMELSRGLGVTVIYVTHDQEEALVMSNRIAVFHRGRIEQIGAPSDLYERPTSVFVAGFIGESNMFTGDLELNGDAAAVRAGNLVLRVDACAARQVAASGKQATIVVRPERLRVHSAASNRPEES
ncbi:MAG: ABC transporter ATP-binding protein, partial [Stellaceae bacterium]